MKILNFIDNDFRPTTQGKWLDNISPHTGKVYSQVTASTDEDAIQAIESAAKAFSSWRKTSQDDRIQLVRKLSQLLLRDLNTFAEAESKDQGKTLDAAKNIDIPRAIDNFNFFADYLNKWDKPSFVGEKGDNLLDYNPLGVVVAITPWNFPLHLLTWKLAPAILTGNCVVAKPSELTPMTAFLLSSLIREAGFPAGVINIIHGTGASVGDTLTTHPLVKAVSFTGSTQTGTHIYARAAASGGAPKKISLEMGGKNPNIIFADCDFDKMLEATLRSSFSNQGEVCTCGSRIFIESALYHKFKTRFLEAIPQISQGALVSESHLKKVLNYVGLAKKEGGKILCGGKRCEGEGYFMEPTVIEGLSYESVVNKEEIFGPVVTLTSFNSESEVIEWANSVSYGLSATVHTIDKDKAQRIARALDVGMVWINDWMKRDLRTPFGGVKSSGLGREGGVWALQFYTNVKNICY